MLYTETMLKKLNKEALLAIAEGNEIEVPGGATNPQIMALILEKGCEVAEDTGALDGKSLEEYNNELVDVVIHRPYYISGDSHADYVVNGVVYSVAYGESQKIPRFVKQAIDNQEEARRILNRETDAAVKKNLL